MNDAPQPVRYLTITEPIPYEHAKQMRDDEIACRRNQIRELEHELASLREDPLVLERKVQIRVTEDDPRWDEADECYDPALYAGDFKWVNIPQQPTP